MEKEDNSLKKKFLCITFLFPIPSHMITIWNPLKIVLRNQHLKI